jgi:hypothetical protein
MTEPQTLRDAATKCMTVARSVTDAVVKAELLAMADKFTLSADQLDQMNKIPKPANHS